MPVLIGTLPHQAGNLLGALALIPHIPQLPPPCPQAIAKVALVCRQVLIGLSFPYSQSFQGGSGSGFGNVAGIADGVFKGSAQVRVESGHGARQKVEGTREKGGAVTPGFSLGGRGEVEGVFYFLLAPWERGIEGVRAELGIG
ncbi:hypothetical protein [Nodosilinea sp. P-1105]|uniref:hypothetical protein n=1 Tax=Nodosilinea sp. P-1105 TaxID=2546229 RepID=UPI0019803024